MTFKIKIGLYLLIYFSNGITQSFNDAISFKSPPTHFSPRICKRNKQIVSPTILVLHYTASSLLPSLMFFVFDPKSTIAPHFTISPTGLIFQNVEEEYAAHHAGESWWRGKSNINIHSIGIEHVNLGYKTTKLQPKGIVRAGSANEWYPFEESQIAASIKLCKHLIQTYNLQPYNIVGHSDVAPGRKVDPGALFPWQRFAQEGIGAWPNFKESWPLPCFIEACNKEMLEEWLLKHLHLWGYKLPDKKTSARAIIQAFQLHFRQQLIDGKADLETAHILNALLCTYHLKKGEECLCQKSNKK